MDKVLSFARSAVDGVRNILRGEPARAIGYGGAAVIYIVAKASGRIPDVTPEEALAQAGAAILVIGGLVESIRRFVYSPFTVIDLTSEAFQDGIDAASQAADSDVPEGNG